MEFIYKYIDGSIMRIKAENPWKARSILKQTYSSNSSDWKLDKKFTNS